MTDLWAETLAMYSNYVSRHPANAAPHYCATVSLFAARGCWEARIYVTDDSKLMLSVQAVERFVDNHGYANNRSQVTPVVTNEVDLSQSTERAYTEAFSDEPDLRWCIQQVFKQARRVAAVLAEE